MKLEFKGTKKEWVLNSCGDLIMSGITTVADTKIQTAFEIPELERKANAKLIAASPCLLEALQYTLEQLKGLDGNNPTEIMVINKCEKAIEKALL